MSATVGDLIYSLSGSNATVTGLNGTPTTIIIPDTITVNATVYNVTAINSYAFQFKSSLTSVTIGNNVKTMGYSVFRDCNSLTSVTIPNSITKINFGVFNNCSALASVTIPASVTVIEEDAFNGCNSLTSVTFMGMGNIPSISSGNFTANTNDTAYYYQGAQNVSRLSPTPAIFTNIVEIVPPTKIFNTNQNIYADGAQGVAVSGSQNGWGFSNLNNNGSKINWYYFSKQISGKSIKVKELNSIHCVITQLPSNVENPFFVIYTTPTGVGDAASWYHTKLFYGSNDLPANVDKTKPILLFTGTDDVTAHPEIPSTNRQQLQLNSSLCNPTTITDSDVSISEDEISAISLQTSSKAVSYGNYNFICSDMGLDSSVYSMEYICVADVVPGAPTITGVTVSSAQASIAFTAGSNDGSSITNYEYRVDGGSSWVSAGTTTSPISVTGLTNGTFYTFQIRAVNGMGAGAASNSVSAVVDVVPGAPTINSVTVSSSQASIVFTAGPNSGSSITNYQYSVNGGSSWVARNPLNTTSPITVTDLTNGEFYTFRIRAVNDMGAGDSSNSVSAVVDVVPGAPTINSVTVSSGQASIVFTAGPNSGSSITNYQYSVNGGSSWVSAGTTTSPITVTDLTNGEFYTFRIRAVNAMGAGDSSNSISALVDVVPDAPLINSVSVSSGRAEIVFTAGSNSGSSITNYECSIDGGSTWVSAGTITSPISVTGLTNGTTYNFSIRAVNAMGASDSSNIVSATVNVVPDAPTITGVKVSSGQADITFTGSNSGSSITGYQYSTNSGSTWSQIISTTTNFTLYMISTTSGILTVTGLTNGTTYVFRIIAVNAMGASTPSNAFSATVNVVPDAPIINSVSVSSGRAEIVFTAGSNSGSSITDYEYSINGGSTWVSAGTITTPITVTGLTNGTIYVFSIRAVNTMGSGAASNIVSKLVRPTLPEAKAQNTLKADYIRYNYSLSDLVNSALYTIAELKLIGAVLGELKQFFTTETLITSWLFTGQELKRERLIDSGITFIYLVILFYDKISINRAYGLNNENKEVTYYNVFNNGAYASFVLNEIVQTDETNNGDNEEISLHTTNWLPLQNGSLGAENPGYTGLHPPN